MGKTFRHTLPTVLITMLMEAHLVSAFAQQTSTHQPTGKKATPASIDRQAVVSRHNPIVTTADPLAALTVGNGHFATTVDVTGMQSYPDAYEQSIPLCTMSDWGWHRFPNSNHLTEKDTQRTLHFPHRQHNEVYAVEYKNGGRPQEATTYFRVNPHRLNLGAIGLTLQKKDGSIIPLTALTNIRQELKLYEGVIESNFKADNQPMHVTTAAANHEDAVLYRIKSPLLQKGQATVSIRFPYPTGKHADAATDWTKPELHSSRIVKVTPSAAIIEHVIDSTHYYLMLSWEGKAKLVPATRSHEFLLFTNNQTLCFKATYVPLPSINKDGGYTTKPFHFGRELQQAAHSWQCWWQSGGIVDFSQCTDPRAQELERRVVLSQYLTQVNCANALPPQETGLTYNSWFGRPHLEMTWWHAVDFSLWNHPETVTQMLDWYNKVAYPAAQQIAERQGFQGVRWMKMTDPWAGEAPSNTGSFLIWQQPHYIYLAEELYRSQPDAATLHRYGEQVEQTARFMADFLTLDTLTHTYQLRGATAMQESMSKDFSYNHPFELSYWRYGLATAQTWRQRRGLPPHPQWADILAHLAPLPQTDSIYTAGQPIDTTQHLQRFDPFDTVGGTPSISLSKPISTETFAEKSRSDHPAVLGACALIPHALATYDPAIMTHTLHWVQQHWKWETTWGWDYGMSAMAAARLGQPSTAINILLADHPKNRYLIQGHNYQTADRLRLYLPGNGALLTAIAMMCAGWDDCPDKPNPGFPDDGTWNIRWENLHPMQ